MTRAPIVSSAHLVSARVPDLSEVEFAAIMNWHAFARWIVRGMTAAGQGAILDLSVVDVLVLHHCQHRERPKRLSDLCLMVNVEDAHIVSYALKKLQKLGLIASERQGKERAYRVSEKGAELCASYRDIREQCLIDAVTTLGLTPEQLQGVASVLRTLSGLYDQASRSAMSM